MDGSNFLLAGNGPYGNRGCEAIVRGTMLILRRAFGDNAGAVNASFATSSTMLAQSAAETDPELRHLALPHGGRRWSADWWRWQLYKLARPVADLRFRRLDSFLPAVRVALQIGGDNYSLDYGWPEPFLALDRHLARCRVPTVIWGASVGPFDKVPARARRALFRHLAGLRAILTRETISYEYLRQHGLTNVYAMSDPAFVMQAREPPRERIGFDMPPAPIGLNLSPLMAGFAAAGDRQRWLETCTVLARTLLEDSRQRALILIPHVTSGSAASDDYLLLQAVRQRLPSHADRLLCLPPTLDAAETKWVIARCAVFAGARTHSTIAAWSSAVPTLSFAYSAKAYGLNQDLFGHQSYCVQPRAWQAPHRVAERLLALLGNAEPVRRRLTDIIPQFQERAFAAGELLRGLLEQPFT